MTDVRADESSITCHPALQIVEILINILESFENADLARCARVCRAWEVLALRLLWRVMPEPYQLFSLLGSCQAYHDVGLVRV